MMKKSELFFSALQVPVDFIMLTIAGVLAFLLRRSQSVTEDYPLFYALELRAYTESLLSVVAVFIFVYAIEGLYNIQSTRKIIKEAYWVFRATAIGVLLIIVGVFFNREWYSSRFVILTGAIFAVFLVTLARVALRSLQRFLLVKKGLGIHRLLLVGVGNYCSIVKRGVVDQQQMGYTIVGHIEDPDLERIERIKKMRGIDELINCNSSVTKDTLLILKDYCLRNRISFKYVPTLLQTANFDVRLFFGEPLIEIRNTPLEGWGKILKRTFDIFGSIAGIIIFSPIMLITAFISWVEGGWPIIFRNERVSHKGDTFDLFKFRYMKKEYCHGKQFSEEHNKKALEYLEKLIKERSVRKGPIYKIKDDPRKTRFGFWIERLSIDELPQFFNVLVGTMSLVGPRPHQPMEVAKYEDYQKRVLTIKPGITGMAQVLGRSDLDFSDEVRLDTYYIENWSLWLDIQIILKTIPILLKKRKN